MVCGVSTSASAIFRDRTIRSSHNIELTVIDLPNPKPQTITEYDSTFVSAIIDRWYPPGSGFQQPTSLKKDVEKVLEGSKYEPKGYYGACHTEAGVMAMVRSIITGSEGSDSGPVELRNILAPAVCPLYLALSHH